MVSKPVVNSVLFHTFAVMKFELQYNDTKTNARAGLITTDHGVIETPIFMPVGTQGAVKAVHMPELKDDIKAQIILGNTYHCIFVRDWIF